jgi:hypothetical protein
MIDELTSQYNAETERLELLRLATWSSVAMQADILGLPCRPLTLQAWIDLKAARNAVFMAAVPSIGDLSAYIWRNHEGYAPRYDVDTRRIQEDITQAIKSAGDVETAAEVIEHFNDAFSETPEDTNPKASQSRSMGFPAIMDAVAVIDEIGNRYGMRPAEVLTMPMAQIFHLQKVIRAKTIEGYKPAQPETLRRLSGRILEEMNNGQS